MGMRGSSVFGVLGAAVVLGCWRVARLRQSPAQGPRSPPFTTGWQTRAPSRRSMGWGAVAALHPGSGRSHAPVTTLPKGPSDGEALGTRSSVTFPFKIKFPNTRK